MPNRRWAIAIAIAGCGGSDPLPDAARPIDAPRPDAACVDACDPLAVSACGATLRCTWLVDPALPRGGQPQCLPSGSIPANAPCMRDAFGGDACVRGATCHADTCRQICDLAGGEPRCTAPTTCKPSPLFAPCSGGAPVAGLCLP